MSQISKLITQSDKTLFVGLAGPGTGKTYTFRAIIDSKEFKDKKILILSFINKLVDDLKEDFSSYENVEVSTLHSFANQQLQAVDSNKKLELNQNLDKIISEDYKIVNSENINYKNKFHNIVLSDKEIEFYKKRQLFYAIKRGETHSFNSIIFSLIEIFSKDESIIPKYDLILVDELQDFNQLVTHPSGELASHSSFIYQ